MSADNIPVGFKSRHRRKRPKQGAEKLPLTTPTSKDHSLAPGQPIAAPPSAKRGKYELLAGSKNSVDDSSPTRSATTSVDKQQQQQPQTTTTVDADGKRKRRRRRAPRRRWKPYYKLTNDERRQLEIREERRAERVRAMRFKHGLPVAPYNTTQFLLNDRRQRGNADEPNDVDEIVANIVGSNSRRQQRHHHQRCRSESFEESVSESGHENSSGSAAGGGSGSGNHGGPVVDGDACGGDDYDNMLEREFDNEYESACAERLESMTKNDLIKEYLELEKQLEKSQRELNVRKSEITDLRQRLSIYEEKGGGDDETDNNGSSREVLQNLDGTITSTAT